MNVGVMKDYKTRVEESTRRGCPRLVTELEHLKIETMCVYLQQNKKKTKAESKNCHAKAMLSLKNPIKFI